MADFSDRNNLKNHLQSAVELARLYNGQQGSQLYSNLLASTMANGKNGLNNRRPSFPQQVPSSGHWDEFIRQQQRAWYSRQGGTQNYGMTSFERELAMQFQANVNLLANAAGANMAWSSGLSGAGDALGSRQRNFAGNSDMLGTIWSPNQDVPSRSISSSKYALGTSVEVDARNDLSPDFASKDGAMYERDSNANVVAKNPMEKSGGLTNESKLRKIWENADPQGAPDGNQIGSGFSGFKSPAFGSFEKWSAVTAPKDVPLSGSDSDEEFAIKSKHFRRSRKASLMSNGSPEDCDDQYGLRSLLKKMKDLPSPTDTAEESVFVEKVSNSFPAPAFNYFKSPFTNQVVSPLCDSYSCPEEYANITTQLSRRLNGPHNMLGWPTEMLFFYFYTAIGDILQIVAANLLHNRGWRYSKSRGIWIARKKDTQPEFKSNTSESGYYQYFNVNKWTREYEYMTLHYNDLADYINFDESKLLEAAQFARINPFVPRVAKTASDPANRESNPGAK